MRIERPYIPLPVRIQVAERQGRGRSVLGASCVDRPDGLTDSVWLAHLLLLLFDVMKYELHHDPALCNRRSYKRMVKGKLRTFYDPPANDPEHLVYLAEDDHDIRTRVRGVGAQRSDLGQRRYLKRVARNRASKTAAKVRRPKVKRAWPSRPFPKRRS